MVEPQATLLSRMESHIPSTFPIPPSPTCQLQGRMQSPCSSTICIFLSVLGNFEEDRNLNFHESVRIFNEYVARGGRIFFLYMFHWDGNLSRVGTIWGCSIPTLHVSKALPAVATLTIYTLESWLPRLSNIPRAAVIQISVYHFGSQLPFLFLFLLKAGDDMYQFIVISSTCAKGFYSLILGILY